MLVTRVLVVALVAVGASQTPAAIHGLSSRETPLQFGRGTAVGNALLETDEGGLVGVGYTSAGDAGGEDVLVVRTDASGRTVWTRDIGSAADDSGWGIARTADGGYMIAGFTSGFGADAEDVLLIGIDAGGATKWTRTIGGPGNQRAWAMVPVGNGFAIAAQTDRSSGGGWDALVLRVDAAGNQVWSRAFGGPGVDRLFGIAAASDGGVAVTGSRSEAPGAALGVLAARLDSSGSVMWDRRFGGARDSLGHAIASTSDGGFVITGYGQNADANNDISLTKLSASGVPAWTRTTGGADDDRGMMSVERAGGGFASIGYRHTSAADWEIWLGEWRADGTPDGERLLGSDGPDRGVMLTRTRGGFAMIGQLGNVNDDSSRLLLARLTGVKASGGF